MEKEEEIQHQIVALVFVDPAHIVLQSIDYIHEELLLPKLVRAVEFDLLHSLPETGEFPPLHVVPAAVAAPIIFAAPILVDVKPAIATPTVSDALFADAVFVPVIPTTFYALCSAPVESR